MKLYRLILRSVLLLLPMGLSAQGYYASELVESATDTITARRLYGTLCAESFFRNNEYNSSIYTGYTLPGFRASGYASYDLPALYGASLSAGIYGLYYWGATRYPSAAYHDVGYWTDHKKHTGTHLLPLFRLSLKPTARSIAIIGSIDGGSAHKLIEPVYNSELNLTADPEAGLQYRYVSERLFLDCWINWESFIYKRDNHQEAFTAGASSEIALVGKRQQGRSSDFTLSLPVAFVASHRGGEYNLTQNDTVHTWLNGYIGVSGSYLLRDFHHTSLSLSSYLLGYSQRGEHYPSDHGHGYYIRLAARQKWIGLSASYWYGKGWIAPHGIPFANAIDAEDKLWPDRRASYLNAQASIQYDWNHSLTCRLNGSVYFHLGRSKASPSYFIEAYMAIRAQIGR